MLTDEQLAEFEKNPGDYALVAAAALTPWAKAAAARRLAKSEAQKNADGNVARFTPDTQPRNSDGRFRKILARLKLNLGDESTQDLAQKIEAAEAAQVAGNYVEMRTAGGDLIKMIGDIEDGDLAKGITKNLRRGASDLGKVMAYLPLPQGDPNAKIRFTDLPPAAADMVRSMVKRVTEQLGPDKAEKYTSELEQYMSGARTMTSDEMATFLNKLLRVLA